MIPRFRDRVCLRPSNSSRSLNQQPTPGSPTIARSFASSHSKLRSLTRSLVLNCRSCRLAKESPTPMHQRCGGRRGVHRSERRSAHDPARQQLSQACRWVLDHLTGMVFDHPCKLISLIDIISPSLGELRPTSIPASHSSRSKTCTNDRCGHEAQQITDFEDLRLGRLQPSRRMVRARSRVPARSRIRETPERTWSDWL